MDSAFFFLATLITVEAFVSNPANQTIVFDMRDVSPLLDAGIGKKTPLSKAALNSRSK